MKTRRKFIAVSAAATSLSAFAEEKPLFSFGLMADCQYVDAEPRGTRFYRESPQKLAAAIDVFNQRDLSFSLHLGDFIDRDFASFGDLEPVAAKLRSKLYHAIGNHDLEVKDEEKALVPGKLGLESGYYSFRKGNFRFIVMDTTDVSTYRYPADSKQSKAAAAELVELQKEGIPGCKPWNGRPGDKQLDWLKSELDAAASGSETVLLFGHHPVQPNEAHAIWNAPEVDQIFRDRSVAKLYINGHNHAGHYVSNDGFHYLTLNGMVETKDTNAFSLAHVYTDRLEINGFGRQDSHILRFR